MAHEIHATDQMFYNGQNGKPWHKLGIELPQLATAQEAIQAANLGWSVNKEPQVRKGVEVTGRFWNVRSDTDSVVGDVGSQYTVLQNVQAFSFFDKFTQDPTGPKYETAGSLFGGKRIWMLAKMPGILEVTPGDTVDPYILLSNSHDGTSAVRVQLTPIRVVCNNTLTMALWDSKQKGIKIRHSGDIMLKAKSVQDALGIIRHSFEDTLGLYQELAKVEPTQAQIETVLTTLFPDTATERAKLQRGRVLELAEAGIGNDRTGVRGTAWALYNGITELYDHHNNMGSKRSDAVDMRVNSNWFGSGAASKAEALELIAKTVLN